MAYLPQVDSEHFELGTIDGGTLSLNEQRRAALAAVDNATFSWFHIKVAIVAGVGFFTDAYDIFAISIASVILGYVYTEDHSGSLSTNLDLGLKVATPVGIFFGQLVFGVLADLRGRKSVYGIELVIITIGTFGQALAGEALAVNVIGVIIVWRFIMGVGVGADYPLSAVIASEFSSVKIRGRLMTAVFASQGWGTLAAALVALVVIRAGRDSLGTVAGGIDYKVLDTMWRLLIGLGCIPACIALYFRLTIPETPRFTLDIERNIQQASQDIENLLSDGAFVVDPDVIVQRVVAPTASIRDFLGYFSEWRNLKVLLGTSWSWFALDIAFYGLNLNSSMILEGIGFGSTTTAATSTAGQIYSNIKQICVGNTILSAAGLIPGYYFTMLLVDVWGRKPIQLMGFMVLSILFLIMGFDHDALTAPPSNGENSGAPGQKVFFALFVLANLFGNFGPNTTTFIIPGEVFPTRYRATCHGISAASGKFGAIISQICFTFMSFKISLIIFGFFMLTGIGSTMFLDETKQKSLEELSHEEQFDFVTGIRQFEFRDGLIYNVSRSRPVSIQQQK